VPEDKTGKMKKVPQSVVDIIIAVILVASIFLAMFAYTGSWPPLVVVESKSMQHSETDSEIGIMDTGDLTMVKRVFSESQVKTYVGSLEDGYKTYGDFGDVVIYWKAGDRTQTPIIHRAVILLEANANGTFKAPQLKGLVREVDYRMSSVFNSWECINDDFQLYHYGYRGMTINIPIKNMLKYMNDHDIPVHGGFITKGDFNPAVDQIMFMQTTEPVSFGWIHGVATGEIPWFGIIKLFFSGSLPQDTPWNSIMFLWITIAIIVSLPIANEFLLWRKDKKKTLEADKKLTSEPKKDADQPAEKKSEPPT
jgi:signal peptidase